MNEVSFLLQFVTTIVILVRVLVHLIVIISNFRRPQIKMSVAWGVSICDATVITLLCCQQGSYNLLSYHYPPWNMTWWIL